MHAPVVDTPVGDDIFDEDYVGYPEEQDLSSVYHDAEEYDPEHGPSTDEDDEVEEMEGYPTPK